MKNIPLFNVLNAILKIIMKTAAYKIFVKHLMVVHSAAPSLASSRNVPIYSQLVVQILIPHDYKSLQPEEAKFKRGISGSTKSVNTQDSRIFHESVYRQGHLAWPQVAGSTCCSAHHRRCRLWLREAGFTCWKDPIKLGGRLLQYLLYNPRVSYLQLNYIFTTKRASWATWM